MKRILALMLAMLMICFALAACSKDEEEGEGGTIDLTVTDSDSVYNTGNEHGDQFYYDYINGDEVIITGYAGSHTPHAVVIPDKIDERPVTAIANCAFMSKTNVTEIALPATVNAIGVSAFAKCTNLAKVNVPEAVITVGDSAFQETAITEITLPNGLVTLGENAFAKCEKLLKATLPAGKVQMIDTTVEPAVEFTVNTVPERLFFGCKSLVEVVWTTTVDRIEAYAFAGCAELTTVPTWSDNATFIGKCAFAECAKITAVTIPATLTEIEEYAFYGCASLTSVTFANPIFLWDLDHPQEDVPDNRKAGGELTAKDLTQTFVAYTWTVVSR